MTFPKRVPVAHEPCQARGDCYHSRGARKLNETWGKTPEAHEARIRTGRIAGRKSNATWGKTPEAHEARSRGARKTNEIWGKTPAAYEARSRGGRKNVKSGHLARIAEGVPSTADGILFRSQTEASFYCVVKELGGEPIYEPRAIDLPGGRSYTPDFILGRSVLGLPANVPIELKPKNAFYQKNLPKAIEAGALVVYWDELVEESP